MNDHWLPGTPLTLHTDRFLLRSLDADDASDAYVSWWNDPEIQDGLGAMARGWGYADAVRHITSFDNRTKFHLGIFPNDAPLPIGFIALFVEPGGLARTNLVVGDKSYWGKRVPYEVRARVLDFLFLSCGIERVYGRIHGRNVASIYNYRALGFTMEGIQRAHLMGPKGSRLDVVLFGLLKDEWLAKREVLQRGVA